MLIIKKTNYLLGIINLWFINVWFYLCLGLLANIQQIIGLLHISIIFFVLMCKNNPVVSTRSRKPYFLLVIG